MLRPLLHLAANEPQLIADHVEAYSELVASELRSASALWKRRLALRLSGFAAWSIAVLLAGVAALLCGVFPPATMNEPWLLVLVPLAPALAGWILCRLGAASPNDESFARLSRQWAADREMLREAGLP
jgi:hypothetical protein